MTNRGYSVFPCMVDKRPYIKEWQRHPGLTVREIEAWCKKNPRTLWGIHCNQGFWVVDVDTYNPKFGENPSSQEFLLILKEAVKVRQRTLNNGFHFFLLGKNRSKNNFMPGVDIKGTGGYVILYHDPVDFTLGLPKSKEEFEKLLHNNIIYPTTNHTRFSKEKYSEQGIGFDEEGIRNTRLFQRLLDAIKTGDRIAWDKAIAIARKSGLDDDEINRTIQSAIKIAGNPPKKNTEPDTSQNNVVSITKDNPLFHPTAKHPYIKMAKPCKIDNTGFAYPEFFPFGTISFVYGDGDTGKSTLMAIISHRNFYKLPLWDGSKYLGDGRKALYLCFERPAKDIFGKLYAAGGNGSEIDIVDKFINSDGTEERLNLRKSLHKEILYKKIKDGDYAFVIFDSVSAILTGNMNDREHVEDVFFDLLDRFEHKRTAFICISHIKKDLRGLAAGGGMLGSVAQKNIAVSVCRLIKKIGEERKSILIKEKANLCKSKRGGLEIELESKSIPQQYAIDGKLDVEKGTIENIKYLDESPEMLRKQCVKDMVSEQKIPYFEMVREIIDIGKRKNNGRLPDTSYVENEIIAKGESPSKWKREQQSILNYLGYTTKSNRLRGKLHKYNIVEIEN